MALRVLVLISTILLAAPAARAADDPKPDPELKLFLGAWTVRSMTEGKTDLKETMPKALRFTDKLAISKESGFLGYVVSVEQRDGEKVERAYFVTSSKKPKEFGILESKIVIPFTSIAAPVGRRGTYAMEKDKLTIYLPPEGKELPKDLSKNSEGLMILELQRVKE